MWPFPFRSPKVDKILPMPSQVRSTIEDGAQVGVFQGTWR